MTSNILQWNLNGFVKRKINLECIVQKYNPNIICLQETHFKDDSCNKLKAYSNIFKNRKTNSHASGGVAIYKEDDINYQEIK